MSNQYIIDTPENVSFGYDVAGIGSRFLAAAVDTLIQWTLIVFLFVVLVLIDAAGMLDQLPREARGLIPVLMLAVLFLIQFGYFLMFELFTGGQTPGKQLFGLRVIKENGFPLPKQGNITPREGWLAHCRAMAERSTEQPEP